MNRPASSTLLSILTALLPLCVLSQDKLQPRLDISYFRSQQEAPYLIVRVRTKEGKKFEPVAGGPVTLMMNDRELGIATTGKTGEGKLVIPDAVNAAMDTMNQFTFSGKMPSTANLEAAEKELDIHPARLTLDTTSSAEGKLVHVLIEQRRKDGWTPVSGVEMKLFVKRQFGRLPVGEETYTSDDQGRVEMEFKIAIPGDKAGQILLGSVIEDHEDFGNLIAYKEVNWGIPFVPGHDEFNDRTLWSTRDKTPVWLLVFPNLIIIVVWGLIFYLILQIVKIRRIGKSINNQTH